VRKSGCAEQSERKELEESCHDQRVVVGADIQERRAERDRESFREDDK